MSFPIAIQNLRHATFRHNATTTPKQPRSQISLQAAVERTSITFARIQIVCNSMIKCPNANCATRGETSNLPSTINLNLVALNPDPHRKRLDPRPCTRGGGGSKYDVRHPRREILNPTIKTLNTTRCRGTSLIRNSALLGPCSRTWSRALRCS